MSSEASRAPHETAAAEAPAEPAAPPDRLAGDPPPRRVWLPIALLAATCASTFVAGAAHWQPFSYLGDPERLAAVVARHWQAGLLYMAAVLGILLTHEMGHFVFAVRHRIPASLPYFIPVPMLPFGTMGAVIGMSGSEADRRQLFDLGIAGPLAGLVVALPVSWIGIRQLPQAAPPAWGLGLHPPLVFRWMIDYLHPGYPADVVLSFHALNPWLMAGWVGMLITGLNMLPISQLDGGHVAYALFGRRAHWLGRAMLIASILYVLATERYGWTLMIVLVTLIGTDHPPSADDEVRLGWFRRVLGIAALAIPILCFTPMGIRVPGP